MKRGCKNIDLCDPLTLYPWVRECVGRHWRKGKFKRLLLREGRMSVQAYAGVHSKCDHALDRPSYEIAQVCAALIERHDISTLPAVHVRRRQDKSNHKMREIGCESALQQVLDRIAVYACEDIWHRALVPQQASSMPGRGQLYGMRMIRGWVQRDVRAMRWARAHGKKYTRQCKYWVKLDVTHCFGSLRPDVVMHHLRRYVANTDVLWLWQALMDSHAHACDGGLMIGSLVSQYAAQLVMAGACRYVTTLTRTIRGKRRRLVSHVLVYMDDMLLVGSNRQQLVVAADAVVRYLAAEGLTCKPTWHIQRLDDTPIDIMGWRIHGSGSVSLRPRVWLRVRRIAARCARGAPSLSQARILASLSGWLVYGLQRLRQTSHTFIRALAQAAAVISNYDRRRNNGRVLQYDRA